LVQRAAQRVNVGAAIDGMAVQALLGGHIVGGSQQLAGQPKPDRFTHAGPPPRLPAGASSWQIFHSVRYISYHTADRPAVPSGSETSRHLVVLRLAARLPGTKLQPGKGLKAVFLSGPTGGISAGSVWYERCFGGIPLLDLSFGEDHRRSGGAVH